MGLKHGFAVKMARGKDAKKVSTPNMAATGGAIHPAAARAGGFADASTPPPPEMTQPAGPVPMGMGDGSGGM